VQQGTFHFTMFYCGRCGKGIKELREDPMWSHPYISSWWECDQ